MYTNTSGKALGGHAVKIVEWGADCWIVKNSWNEKYADNGTFKIFLVYIDLTTKSMHVMLNKIQ